MTSPAHLKAAAVAREGRLRRYRGRRRVAAHTFRAVAIVTSVAVLWAVTYVLSYEWLAPTLYGAR